MSEGQEMKSIALIAHDNKKTELSVFILIQQFVTEGFSNLKKPQ